jgi:hypothetical protein
MLNATVPDRNRDSIDRILARTRERVRRKKLEGQLERQERKLDSLGRIGPTTPMLRRGRAFRLMSQIKKLRAQLAQPELLL